MLPAFLNRRVIVTIGAITVTTVTITSIVLLARESHNDRALSTTKFNLNTQAGQTVTVPSQAATAWTLTSPFAAVPAKLQVLLVVMSVFLLVGIAILIAHIFRQPLAASTDGSDTKDSGKSFRRVLKIAIPTMLVAVIGTLVGITAHRAFVHDQLLPSCHADDPQLAKAYAAEYHMQEKEAAMKKEINKYRKQAEEAMKKGQDDEYIAGIRRIYRQITLKGKKPEHSLAVKVLFDKSIRNACPQYPESIDLFFSSNYITLELARQRCILELPQTMQSKFKNAKIQVDYPPNYEQNGQFPFMNADQKSGIVISISAGN